MSHGSLCAGLRHSPPRRNRSQALRNSMSKLQDKVAIVTGAAQGIGAAYARALAIAGASVVVADVIEPSPLVSEIEAAGGRAIGRVTDVADPAAVSELVAAAIAAFGRIDILVNNAAIFGRLGL